MQKPLNFEVVGSQNRGLQFNFLKIATTQYTNLINKERLKPIVNFFLTQSIIGDTLIFTLHYFTLTLHFTLHVIH